MQRLRRQARPPESQRRLAPLEPVPQELAPQEPLPQESVSPRLESLAQELQILAQELQILAQEMQFLAQELRFLAVRLLLPVLGDLLPACDRDTFALAGTRVRVGALTANGQSFAMTKSLVATNLDLPLDVLGDFATKIPFDRVVGIDELADAQDFGVAEIANFRVVVDVGRAEDLIRPRLSNPVDIGGTNLNPLVPREINSGNACHSLLTPVAACGEGSRRSPRRGHAAG
jgi:hypothetical protein